MNLPPRLRRLALPAAGALLALSAASAAQPLRSGVDKADFDPSIRPQDDLYRHVNGRWLARTPIPPDQSNYGAFTILALEAEAHMKELLEHAAAHPEAVTPQARKAAALYHSFMDEATLATRGLEPLRPEFARIDALRTPEDVAAYLGYSQTIGIDAPLRWYVEPDPRDTGVYLPGISQGGLSLPDRDYYLREDARYAGYREQLRGYVRSLLQAAGDADAEAAAELVTSIEHRLAAAQWSRVQNRDPVATYNRSDREALARLAPRLDWNRYFEGVGARVPAVNVDQPSFLTALDTMAREIPAEQWRTYFRYRLLDAMAPYLPAPFERLHFDFHEHALSGIEQQRERWKRAVSLTDEAVGEITGQMYVEKYFSAASRQRTQALVANLLKAFDRSIDGLDWMTPPTRAAARVKLAAIGTKIGYPDKWRDYSALRVEPDDLAGNVLRAAQFEQRRQIDRLDKPVDRSEWHMTPQTVNAYYNPLMNEIVFPAAILQPPFFDPRADDAANYGGIGAVIGHEISHAFDDAGRQFDEKGNLRDWWTAEDAQRFKQRTAALAAEFSAYTVLDGQHLNGELTLGENIADLSGLSIAYKAWQIALGRTRSPVIDGLSGAQRFFIGWAQVWRRNYREDNLRQRLSVDPHSPSEYRCNGPVRHIDGFYDAFGVKPGDKLYRPPGERIRIW